MEREPRTPSDKKEGVRGLPGWGQGRKPRRASGARAAAVEFDTDAEHQHLFSAARGKQKN